MSHGAGFMITKVKATSQEWYRAIARQCSKPISIKFCEVWNRRAKLFRNACGELSQGLASSNHESKELDRALRFLTMLVNCAARTARSPGMLTVRQLPSYCSSITTNPFDGMYSVICPFLIATVSMELFISTARNFVQF